MTDQTQYVDPCPQCKRGGVCDTPTCGRKRSSEYMARYGVPQLGMHITDKEIIRVYAKHVDLVGAAHEIIKLERERCAKICDNYSLRIAMRGCHDWPSAPEVAGDLAEEIREKK